MFSLWQLLTMVFVLFGLSTFVVLIVIRFNRKRIEHGDELVKKDVEKDIAVKKTAFETQEAERKRIGEDLHDDIGPQLGLMKMQLSMITMKNPEMTEALQPLRDQLKGTMKHVREVSHDLVPAVLYELGLATALKSISSQLDNMVGLHSITQIDDDLPSLDKKKELAIYRIVQESVNNAIKHADASQIDIHLTQEKGQVIAKVIDDGSGIAEDKKDVAGLGLTSMKERAAAFHGEVSLLSDANQGTVVSLILPI